MRLALIAAAFAFVQPGGVALAQQRPVTDVAGDSAKAPKAPLPSASASAESGLRQRVETLEEQLVDLQVTIGTLESLAKSGVSNGAPAFRSGTASSAADTARIETLETQIRAMTAQIEQLSDQVRSLGGQPPQRRGDLGSPSEASRSAQANGASDAPAFGSTTVTTGNPDQIGGLIASDNPNAGRNSQYAAAPAGVPQSAEPAELPGIETSNPKLLYETAYGHLLQRDYGAAETAFDDFLKRFPSDSLAGNAQYWLGESHFVRGQYKAAASAFLKGYQTYAASPKAPDSLLKLGMSLDRLGQKDAACSSYNELATRFPTAPQSVKARVQSERQRVGCS